jgi:hypothetical protein
MAHQKQTTAVVSPGDRQHSVKNFWGEQGARPAVQGKPWTAFSFVIRAGLGYRAGSTSPWITIE